MNRTRTALQRAAVAVPDALGLQHTLMSATQGTKRKACEDMDEDIPRDLKRAKVSTVEIPAPQDPPTHPETTNEPRIESDKKKGKGRAIDPEASSNRAKYRKLAPPRPFPTVPTSVSATGPRSAHVQGKNYICITRKTPLAAYLRRCKDVILKDGCVASTFCLCISL